MKFTVGVAIVGLSLFSAAPSMSAEYTAVVSRIQANHDTDDCIFFRLNGVTGITPSSPGDWFAISRSSLGAVEAFAVLLTSRAKNIQVTVQTTGALACGNAQATYVTLL